MSEAVQTVARRVDEQCYTTNYRKEGCSISMSGVPADRVVIDLDCGTLQLHDTPRCDFLFVGADSDGTRVAPIELKNGRFSGSKVADQLQGGADAADGWLPSECSFRFVPVLVHGKRVHKRELKSLRNRKIKIRNQEKQTVLIRCGAPLMSALRVGER